MQEKPTIMSLKSLEDEYQELNSRDAWLLKFHKIYGTSHLYPYTCIEAKKPQNKSLNRYRDVNPYDHSRIKLSRTENDYINANMIKVDRASRKYILTQGPLVHTAGHFWLMVWEQKSRAILMLNKIVEKDEIKCHLYWPTYTGKAHQLTFQDVKLAVELVSSQDKKYYSTRVFRLTDLESEEERTVLHYHFTTWPDFGVPACPRAFLKYLHEVRSSGSFSPDVGPAIVHCSAGIGRSGSLCLVDSCLAIIEKEGCYDLDIQEVLLKMRQDRMGLIQTADQLKFSYKAILEGAKMKENDWSMLETSDNLEEESESDDDLEEEEEKPPTPPPRDYDIHRKLERNNVANVSDAAKVDNQTKSDTFAKGNNIANSDGGAGDALRLRRARPSDGDEPSEPKKPREEATYLKVTKTLIKPICLTVTALLVGIAAFALMKR